MTNAQNTKQKGFTLIELVIVIAIIGVLSAIALPKFLDLSAKARIASLGAAKGSLNAISALAKANYLVTNPKPASVTAEGVVITYSTGFASGYPKADVNLAAGAGLSASDYTITAAGTTLTVSPLSAPTAATCSVVYSEPASATSTPTLTLTTTGC
jgi:MSHA pilin protein MshA